MAEHVLLIQPGVPTQGRERIDALIMRVNHALNPNIDRREREPVIAKEHHAAGHLDADPGE